MKKQDKAIIEEFEKLCYHINKNYTSHGLAVAGIIQDKIKQFILTILAKERKRLKIEYGKECGIHQEEAVKRERERIVERLKNKKFKLGKRKWCEECLGNIIKVIKATNLS